MVVVFVSGWRPFVGGCRVFLVRRSDRQPKKWRLKRMRCSGGLRGVDARGGEVDGRQNTLFTAGAI